MLFPTAEYAIFFIGAFAVAWALRPFPNAHKLALVVGSWAFYAFWDWRFLPLLVGLSLLASGIAQGLEVIQRPRPRALLLASGIGLCLLVLGAFKYLSFATQTVLDALEALGVRVADPWLPEVALPVGVSFFVFHAISLMVDSWRRSIVVRIGWLDSMLYVAFFPQLVAGPILRASRFLPQLASPEPPTTIDAARAFQLVARGLVKKVLVAQVLASRLVDPVFDAPQSHSALEVLLGIYGYAVQIFCDFSGYTDIAIGSALLLGYQMPENFDAPYRAQSPRDFWRRWHVSLSTWLRDYLFIPLGGSRHGRTRTVFALLATMILGGLWHGPAWTFVLWGALHGVGLVVHRLWAESGVASIRRLRGSRAWRPLAGLLTFHFVCAGWVLFRSPSIAAALEVFARLGGGGVALGCGAAAVLLLAVGLAGQFVPTIDGPRRVFARWPLAAQGVGFAVFLMLLEALSPRGVAPFIYFRF